LWEGGKVISVLGGLNLVVLDDNTRVDMVIKNITSGKIFIKKILS